MSYTKRQVSRRDFLKMTGVGGAAALATVSGFPGQSAFNRPSLQASDTQATLSIFDFGSDKQLKIYDDDIARFLAP